jgi:hypothetical protein
VGLTALGGFVSGFRSMVVQSCSNRAITGAVHGAAAVSLNQPPLSTRRARPRSP